LRAKPVLGLVGRVIVLLVFWTSINNLLINTLSGKLISDLLGITTILFSKDLTVLTSLLTLITPLLAVLTVITLSHKLYVITSLLAFLSSRPDPTYLVLVTLGLLTLLSINTYLTSLRGSREGVLRDVKVEGSKTSYPLLALVVCLLVISSAYLIYLYIDLFFSFVGAIPPYSRVRVLSDFLTDNPIGKALLTITFLIAFIEPSHNLVEALAYFISPNPELARVELRTAIKTFDKIKYPFYSLMSFILALYVAPPLYVVSSFIYSNYVLRMFPALNSVAGPITNSVVIQLLTEIIFFMLVWGLFRYVTKFFRDYVSKGIISAFLVLLALMMFAQYLGHLSLDETLTNVYFTYYRNFLRVGELLLQLTGFVP